MHLVEAMLTTKAQVFTAETDSDRTYLEDKCAGLDRLIDKLVPRCEIAAFARDA